MRCNYCGSEESTVVAEYTRFEKRNVLQCLECGLVYLEMNDERRAVESFYASEYRKVPTLPVMSPDEHFSDRVTRNDSEERIRFLSKYLDCRGKKILEIGSASGSFLQKLAEAGCREITGIELSKEYAAYARKLGFTVYERSIEELGLEGVYDAIVSFHTIEHVYDPKAVFEAVYSALKPEGLFIGEVPNQNDWRIQIFNDDTIKRFHYDPNHYYYFSPKTIMNYFNYCGFTDIKLETVERYTSLIQLRNILCKDKNENIESTLKKYIFTENPKDEVRLPDIDDKTGLMFNKVFATGVNSELMGNCLRWIARRN